MREIRVYHFEKEAPIIIEIVETSKKTENLLKLMSSTGQLTT